MSDAVPSAAVSVAPPVVERPPSLGLVLRDFASLTKPRLSAQVLSTAAGGMYLAPGHLSPLRAGMILLATAGTIGAANALNCYLERDSDRLMARTRLRPLPAGRMEPSAALAFGIALGVLSVPALALASNLLTGALGLLALLSYVLAYTPMKARSATAMLVGGIPGALPPLMGWTALTGSLDLPGVVLFAILFLWQIPHFLAIALFRKKEYAAAGLKSVPLVQGDAASRAQLLGYLIALVPVTVLPYILGVSGLLYLVVAVALGVAFLGYGAWGFFKKLGAPWARRLFFGSLFYLTGLFFALVLDAT